MIKYKKGDLWIIINIDEKLLEEKNKCFKGVEFDGLKKVFRFEH